jgi:hypothetical protein
MTYTTGLLFDDRSEHKVFRLADSSMLRLGCKNASNQELTSRTDFLLVGQYAREPKNLECLSSSWQPVDVAETMVTERGM